MESQPKIFINYRRHGDAPGFALRLYKDLEERFGREHLFKDLRNIGPGEDFVESFSKEVDSCRVFLVVIGKEWLSILDRKLAEKKQDFVHLELRTALGRRDRNKQSILIIPVLVDDAEMPGEADLPDDIKGLAALNEHPLPEEYWDEGVQRLVKHLREVLGAPGKREADVARGEGVRTVSDRGPESLPERSESKSPNFTFGVVGGGIGGLLTGALVGAIYSMQQPTIPWWRFVISSLDGLVVGAIGAAFISYGILQAAKLLKGSWYARIVGGALGGAVGGIPMIILGGMIFFWSAKGEVDPVLNAIGGGEVVNPLLIAIAVAASSFFIALGLLAPARHEIPISVFIVACVAVGILMLTIGVMAANLEGLKKQLAANSPFLSQVLIFGSLFGLVAGLQVSLSLLFFDRFSRANASEGKLEIRD